MSPASLFLSTLSPSSTSQQPKHVSPHRRNQGQQVGATWASIARRNQSSATVGPLQLPTPPPTPRSSLSLSSPSTPPSTPPPSKAPSQPPSPPPSPTPASSASRAQNWRKSYSTSSSPVKGLKNEHLVAGSIVFIPAEHHVDSNSEIHRWKRGTSPFGHPAVIKEADQYAGLVSVYLLTGFTTRSPEDRQRFGAGSSMTLEERYPNNWSPNVRREQMRYLLIGHPHAKAEEERCFSNPDGEAPELTMLGGEQLARPCYVNVESSYWIEPTNLQWNRVGGTERRNAQLEPASVKKMLQWANNYLCIGPRAWSEKREAETARFAGSLASRVIFELAIPPVDCPPTAAIHSLSS